MSATDEENHLTALLASLFNAGWRELPKKAQGSLLEPKTGRRLLVLQRSCMVVGVEHVPEPHSREQLAFVPIVDHLVQPGDGIGWYDAVAKPVQLRAAGHGLMPFAIRDAAAQLGLLDPTRFSVQGDDPAKHVAFLVRLYSRYIGRVAATWRGGHTVTALKALDADEPFNQILKALAFLAPNVVPDAVPMPAAIGITLDCWRHTELETAHVGSQTLSDVVMAKLNIATTRSVRAHITSGGIDWDAVTMILVDPDRQLSDGRRVVELVDEQWPPVLASIEAKLRSWRHIEELAGPEATLRLLSLMGSTDYTDRWWGNGWWPDFSKEVFVAVRPRTKFLSSESGTFLELALASDLAEHPEDLPDDVLRALIDPPNGNGLRHADVPPVPMQLLGNSTSTSDVVRQRS